MNAKERATSRRGAPTAAEPEVRLVCGARHRSEGRLDHALGGEIPDDPSLAALVAAAAPYAHAESWMLAGGEPTLRSDLPALVGALAEAGAPRLGLVTDGLAFAAPGVAAALQKRGLSRVRIRLHAARADAHDWLEGRPGAFKRVVKAVRACVEAGLETEIACTVTRPTFAFLDETVELFVRLGVDAVLLRRVVARGPALLHDVAVAPRLALVGRDLEKAVQVGVRSGLTMMVEGFPRCAAPGAAGWMLPTDAVVTVVPSEGTWPFLAPSFGAPAHERGCAGCPGTPGCAGAPVDYVRRFGRAEIDSESSRLVNPGVLPPTPLQGGDVYPPPRAGRFPPSRLAYSRLAARLPSLGGDPLVALQPRGPRTPPEVLRFVFLGPDTVAHPDLADPGPSVHESTRDVRIRLVKAAQEGARTLRVAGGGTLAHPAAADLLRETTRLQFERIEVAGEAAGLDAVSDMELRRLRGISRVDVALFGPDAATHDAVVGRPGAFEAALRALDRLGSLVPSIELGCYAVLTSEEHLAAFAEAWDFGDLPGAPFFRLARRGGSLVALAEAASRLPEGPARDAIAAVLPKALFDRPAHVVPAPEATDAWGEIPDAYRGPSGSDRYGCYTRRPSGEAGTAAGGDPGFAVGWLAD